MGHQTRLRRGVQFSNRHSCHHEVGTTRSKSPFSGRISIRARRRSIMKSWSSNKRKFLFLFLPLLLLPVYPRAISNSSRGKFFLDQLLRAEQTLCLFFLSFFFYFSLSNKFTTIVTSRNLSSAKTLIFESRWSLFFCRRGNRTAALEQPRCVIHFKKTQPDGFCIVSSNTISRIFLERTVRKILPLRKLNSAVKRKGKFILARQKHRSFPGKESLSSIPVCTGHVYVFTATSAVRTALAFLYKPDSFSFLLLARYLYIYI